MGGAERVGWLLTLEVRWDQSHLIPLLSHQAPKSNFALFYPESPHPPGGGAVNDAECNLYLKGEAIAAKRPS